MDGEQRDTGVIVNIWAWLVEICYQIRQVNGVCPRLGAIYISMDFMTFFQVFLEKPMWLNMTLSNQVMILSFSYPLSYDPLPLELSCLHL